MELVSGKKAAQRVGNMISPNHQVHAFAVDLTAKQVYILYPTGQVDFGGGEYMAAERHELPSHRRHSQDPYHWWNLVHGAYQVEFNETLELANDEIGVLAPHERLLRAGAQHPAVFLRGRQNPITTVLSVTSARLQLKQNARLSSLRVFRLRGARAGAKAGKKAAASAKKQKR